MPTQIDRCASCGHPVFQEEAISGGCACPERGLRLLLAAERHRNGGGVPARPQPALDPVAIMSQSGRGEYEAARRVAARPAPPRGRPRVAAVVDEENFFGDDDWTGDWRGPVEEAPNVAMSQMDLAAMWMQGTGIPFDPSQLVGAPGADDFEFSTGADIDVRAASQAPSGGGSGGRFRVDRPAPPRPAFDRTTVNNQGPMREAGRVRDRFSVLREVQPAGAPRIPVVAQVQESFASPEPVPVKLSAIQQARVLRASVQPSGPSTYDRLRRNTFSEK